MWRCWWSDIMGNLRICDIRRAAAFIFNRRGRKITFRLIKWFRWKLWGNWHRSDPEREIKVRPGDLLGKLHNWRAYLEMRGWREGLAEYFVFSILSRRVFQRIVLMHFQGTSKMRQFTCSTTVLTVLERLLNVAIIYLSCFVVLRTLRSTTTSSRRPSHETYKAWRRWAMRKRIERLTVFLRWWGPR